MRRLTHSQYDHTVRDLLGDQIQPASSFPKEDFISGFKNQVEGQGISPLQAEAYGKAAERLAAAAFRGGDQRGLIPRQADVGERMRTLRGKFVRQFGLKAFRRPLADDEVGLYAELCLEEAGRTKDFLSGAGMVIEAMLQSPHFLFRIERGGENAQYEIASRLSYFLWDTMPSDELLAAAAKGELATASRSRRRRGGCWTIRGRRRRSTSSWRSGCGSTACLSATRDRRRFREFNAEVAAAMVGGDAAAVQPPGVGRPELHGVLHGELHVREQRPGPAVWPAGTGGGVWRRSSIRPSRAARACWGMAAFWCRRASRRRRRRRRGACSSATTFSGMRFRRRRRAWIRCCRTITEDAPLTNRQRLEVHLNSEACAGCHRLIDPIGLGV